MNRAAPNPRTRQHELRGRVSQPPERKPHVLLSCKTTTWRHQVKPVNLAEKLSTFAEHWQPRVVGQFNGHDLMVVKVKGEFVWHKHDDTDDFFLVLQGRMRIQLRGEEVSLGPGEVFVVPRGVEHRPVAEEEAHVLLIEPAGTPNTGNSQTAAPRRIV
jgi:mannose-6-phosphate isomerase-like protein (cupin superfamily)